VIDDPKMAKSNKEPSALKKHHHNPNTGTPRYRIGDPKILALQSMPSRPQVIIYDPALEDDGFRQVQAVNVVHKALVQYLSDWFQIPTQQTWNFNAPAQILIVDELHLPTLLVQRPDFLDTTSRQCIIILCANYPRQSILARNIHCAQVELLCKPFGPYKLARALCRALENATKANTRTETVHVTGTNSNASPSSTPLLVTQRGNTFSDASRNVNRTGLASQPHIHTNPPDPLSLNNALSHDVAERQVLFSSVVKEVKPSPDGGFPFIETAKAETSQSGEATQLISSASAMPNDSAFGGCLEAACRIQKQANEHSAPRALLRANTVSIEATLRNTDVPVSSSTVPTSAAGAYTMADAPPKPNIRKPRLLLVDDNKVNINLLHMFVRRKGFSPDLISLAEDGQQAVDSYRSSATNGIPPDIIFMDISMPVMDGYEATRIIRRLERERNHSGGILETVERKRAFIVALTGNAGGNDKAEAFESGVDVYMTKPMSMKEVGKILDHWR